MDGVKRYRMLASGRYSVDPNGMWVLGSDFDAALAREAALREELADMQHWRDLALQFDKHRMTALWHLKTLAVNPSYAPAVSDFLASPPLPASEIVQRLTAAEHDLEFFKQGKNEQFDRAEAAEQRNAVLTSGLKLIITRCNAGWSCHAIELTAEEALEDAALKPTESGASE